MARSTRGSGKIASAGANGRGNAGVPGKYNAMEPGPGVDLAPTRPGLAGRGGMRSHASADGGGRAGNRLHALSGVSLPVAEYALKLAR